MIIATGDVTCEFLNQTIKISMMEDLSQIDTRRQEHDSDQEKTKLTVYNLSLINKHKR